MKKILPLTLVLIGAALLITAVVFWIDSSTSVEPDGFGKSLRDWITLISGLGVSIKGWIDLLKKEKPLPPSQSNEGGGIIVSGRVESVGEDIVGRDKIIQNIHLDTEKVAAIFANKASSGDHQENPYRGLSAFGEKDAPFFYGREMAVNLLSSTVLQHPRFIAVIGPSGSGKSSLISAGLIPKLLKSDSDWVIAKCRPGSNPFDELASALLLMKRTKTSKSNRIDEIRKLADSLKDNKTKVHRVLDQVLKGANSKHLLLVIDQFEELYTQCSDIGIRYTFLDKLVALATEQRQNNNYSLTMIVALRADFLEQVLGYRHLADVFDRSPKPMLGPMSSEELEMAIIYPARKLKVEFEGDLSTRILYDVGKEPGNLPLLEFALTLLWDRQESGKLTYKAYDTLGKVQGALTHYADFIYSTLSSDEQELGRQIFVQLIEPGEKDTRRLATKIELGEKKWELVQKLATSRMLVTSLDHTGQPIVEIVHEALIQNWGRLQTWMNEDREFRVWQEQFRDRLHQWKSRQRDPRALLDGLAFDESERWYTKRGADFGQVESEFFLLSLEQQSLEEKQRREQTDKIRELQEEVVAVRQLSALGTAIAAIQHRINNTFNIIVPNVVRLRKRIDPNDATAKEILDIIERNARYTSEIIQRIQEPLKEVESVQVNINAVIGEMVSSVKQEKEDGISISLNLDDSIPAIFLPSGQIAEVIRNLIDNALYVMKNKGNLSISTSLEKASIKVRVQDSGPGISSDLQQRLFEKPIPSKAGSAGLGLWLSRLVMQGIGGGIKIEKSDSSGTTMLIVIPLEPK